MSHLVLVSSQQSFLLQIYRSTLSRSPYEPPPIRLVYFSFRISYFLIFIQFTMPKLTITGTFVSCKSSTRGDTCTTGCCLKQSGTTGDYFLCTTGNACSSNSTLKATYDTCSSDAFNNICAHSCCGTYDDGTNSTMTVCEFGGYCNNLYAPMVLAKATPTQIKEFETLADGGISRDTGLAIGLGIGLLAVIGIIMGIVIWKLKKQQRALDEEIEDGKKFTGTVKKLAPLTKTPYVTKQQTKSKARRSSPVDFA